MAEVGCGLLRRPGDVIRNSAGGVLYFRKSCWYIDCVHVDKAFLMSVQNSLVLLSLKSEDKKHIIY